MASQITDVSCVCSTVCSGVEHRKDDSSVSLVLVRGIHCWPADFPHKGPVTRNMFSFDNVIKTWNTMVTGPIPSANDWSWQPIRYAKNSLQAYWWGPRLMFVEDHFRTLLWFTALSNYSVSSWYEANAASGSKVKSLPIDNRRCNGLYNIQRRRLYRTDSLTWNIIFFQQ